MLCAAASISKRSLQLLNWNPPAGFVPDLVIAHNPAAFYPAYFFARKWSAPFAIDVEDYHPGENIASSVKLASARLMGKLLDKAAYVSYASPLIREYALKHTKRKSNSHVVVNNVFPHSEFRKLAKESAPKAKLKLVWFSQHIDYGRGIERILPILDRYSDCFQLTLIGSCRSVFRKQEVARRNYIVCKEPLSQAELHAELGLHDIGLALEDPLEDLNRDICLTNKIWAYFQSGLFIVASDTLAQRSFIHQFPDHGVLTSFASESVCQTAEYLLANRTRILLGYADRFDKSKSYSWEQECGQLICQWRKVLYLPLA
jgi:glycosyltransferase involved in cell wall biosynthesis